MTRKKGDQEGLPAHEVQTTIDTNESTSPHVPNEAIVLNGKICLGKRAERVDGAGRWRTSGSDIGHGSGEAVEGVNGEGG